MEDPDTITTERVEVSEVGLRAEKSSRVGMFSNPQTVHNRHATFQDVAGDVHYHNYLPAGPGERSLVNREEPSTSSNKSELPSQLYSRLLMQEGRGYPLLDAGIPNELPEQYQLHGVMIGDVGIVTQDGYFDVLFNICEPAEGDINDNCVPEGFIKLERPRDNRRNYRRGVAYEPGAWAISDNVQVTSHPLTHGNPPGTYEFECGFAEGAILALPSGSSKEDLVNLEPFLQYASKHGVSWYEFANGRLGRRVANGSIYLITGYDKASTWGTASFFASAIIPRFRMHFTGKRWNEPGRAIVKQVQNSQADSPLPENQCTFLRGYKVTLSNRILARICGINVVETSPIDKIQEGPDQSQRSFFNLLGVSAGLGFVVRYMLSAGGSSIPHVGAAGSSSTDAYHTSLTSTTSPLSLEIHPSNLINLYLLSKFPESDLAITHDSVWCSYLEMRKKNGSQVLGSLLEYVDSKYRSVHKDGTAYLGTKADVIMRSPDGEVSSDEESLYEVESVLCARVERKKGRKKVLVWKYKVRWKGYPPEDDTWEPEQSFSSSSNLLDGFWERAQTNGRDHKNIKLFEVGEEFVPVGPRLKRKPTQRKQGRSTLQEFSSPEDSESESPPPHKRGRIGDPLATDMEDVIASGVRMAGLGKSPSSFSGPETYHGTADTYKDSILTLDKGEIESTKGGYWKPEEEQVSLAFRQGSGIGYSSLSRDGSHMVESKKELAKFEVPPTAEGSSNLTDPDVKMEPKEVAELGFEDSVPPSPSLDESTVVTSCTAVATAEARNNAFQESVQFTQEEDELMWTLINAPTLPRYGENPLDETAPQTQPLAEQRPAEHEDQPAGEAPLTRLLGQQRPGRPRPEWAPDCPFSVQDEFSVPGVLCTSQYICQWDDCQFSTNRESFDDCRAYQQSVYNHIKEHMGQTNAPSSCQWRSCATRLQPGARSERNRIRHFTTHIPWYYLCPNCGVFRARPDAQQGASCLTGKCRALDERIAMKLAEARAKYGNLTDRFTIQGLCSIVLNPESVA